MKLPENDREVTKHVAVIIIQRENIVIYYICALAGCNNTNHWTLTAEDENDLLIFERQILKKTFGPFNIDNIWRTRNNMEIN